MASRARTANRFQSIREWDGTQDRAFEELCYQLRDSTPAEAELIKTRPPDAGVEWYWRYADGTEWGWQVKFVFDTDGLIDAMRRSLRTVAEKRPKLRKLTFCIPTDLADDPSRARGRQGRERFEAAKARWREFAPDVEIELLAGGQLLERLARDEHRGREWFFFGTRVLDGEWCARELRGTIEDAGDRYTPAQNVDLPIDRILEALAHPADFEASLEERVAAVFSAGRELLAQQSWSGRWSEALDGIRDELVSLEQEHPIGHEPPRVASAGMLTRIDDTVHRLDDLTGVLRPIAWPEDSERPRKWTAAEKAVAAEREQARYTAQSLFGRCRDVGEALYDLRAFVSGVMTQAAERKTLFVEGAAGRGKTHLFCDVAERLLHQGHLVIVLLGERFRDPSPWRTLASLLGEPGLSPQEVATVLASSGEASGRRTVLLIDAINEAADPAMWASELGDMRRRLTESGWVGFAVSCRTTYLDLVEPPGGPDREFVRVEHVGYRGREFQAIDRIFEVHGLQQPRVPLLLPEFSDPLFLKLYCEGIKDDPAPPTGSDHLSGVFRRFVDARTKRVEKKLGLDRRLGIVGQAMDAFANRFAEQGAERLPYPEVHALINQFAPHLQQSPNTLLEAMAGEGLLAVDRGWLANHDRSQELVSFPYQRFSDHLILRAFIDSKVGMEEQADLSGEAVKAEFAPDRPLGQWLAQAPNGLVEALAIQLPERWGVELPDLVPEPEQDDWTAYYHRQAAEQAFIASIVVRERSAISERTTELVDELFGEHREEVADALISVAPDPEHPFNADRLHAFLMRHQLADRDAFWTQLLYDAFGDPQHSLDRLIRWAARGPYPAYPEKVIELASIPLAWQLASPNRFARDYTTKALATLLIDRPRLCARIVRRFASADDPYVKQRLAAAMLGAITRSNRDDLDRQEVRTLLETLIAAFIEQASPDILTRDYIASLARWLRRRKLITPTLLRRAQPPYGSPAPRVPRSEEYLRETYPEGRRREEGYSSLQFSALTSHSDWSRYVVSGQVDDFLPVRLGEPIPVSQDPEPQSLWRVDRAAWTRFARSLRPEQETLLEALAEDADADADATAFRDTLDESQRKLLEKVHVPRRRLRRTPPRPMAFPPARAARFIFQRCIELGWTPERFGTFDASAGRSRFPRDANKPERFGKKYQWIAFHELMARLADNFLLKDWRDIVPYEGAWQLRVRDIDPTLAPERIELGDDQQHLRYPTFPVDAAHAWWTPPSPTFDALQPGREGEWAELYQDLPGPEQILRVTAPDDNRFLVLHGHHSWREAAGDGASVTAESTVERDVAIMSRGTIVRADDLARLNAWLAEQPDLVRALPDWHQQSLHDAFWSELPEECGSHGYPRGWRRRYDLGKLPVSSAAVHLGYGTEASGYDCSITRSSSVELPSEFLRRLLEAIWDPFESLWRGTHKEPVAQYRETDEGFHRDYVLMYEETALARLLVKNRLAIAIGLFCERRVFERAIGRSDVKAVGWLDYVSHVIFDGKDWKTSNFEPIERRA